MNPVFLVTGADGFVGRHLVSTLKQRGFRVIQAVRRNESLARAAAVGDVIVTGDIGSDPDWDPALKNIDVIVHLAAYVHHAHEAHEVVDNYHRINVSGTEKLARSAAVNGVKRFVYVSSIGVNGNKSTLRPITEQDQPQPYNPYTLSKWQAEETLKKIARETGLEVVILRPPLVYGSGNHGNFWRLLKLVATGIPLPLRSIVNRRSLIYAGNLVDAIILCSIHPSAVGNTYLVKDGDDISTPDLVRELTSIMGLKSRLIAFPTLLLRLGGKITGKYAQVVSLVDSLVIDDSKIRGTLGWRPPYTLAAGLRETVGWFKQ